MAQSFQTLYENKKKLKMICKNFFLINLFYLIIKKNRRNKFFFLKNE